MTPTTAQAHAARIMDRMRVAYTERLPLPRSDGLHAPPCEEVKTGRCACVVPERMSLNQLQRLYRAIVGEFEG